MAEEQQNPRVPRLRNGCAAFGAVLLLWTIGLGVYSAVVAHPIPCGKCGDYGAAVAAARHAIVAEAWIAVGCAVLLLGVLVLARVRAHRGGADAKGDAMAAWAAVVLLAWTVVALLVLPGESRLDPAHLVTFYRRAMTGFTVTDQLPTAVAAVALTAIGCTAVAGARATLQGHRRAAAAGAVLAIMVGVAATTAAVRAGDDDRYVDATSAAAQAMPSVPDTLGRQRFHLTVAQGLPFSEHAAEFPSYAPVFAAGAGFVVWRTAADGVFAYDAAGHERWHYRRTGPGQVQIVGVHVYDQGKTVVLKLGSDPESANPSLVGLDALTGNRLWSASDAALAEAFDDGGYWTPTPFLVARAKTTWVGFDAGTGRQIWRIPNPLRCGGGQDADTATRLASIEDCRTDQQLSFRLVTVDPRTGQLLADRLVLKAADTTQQDVNMIDVRPVSSEGLMLGVGYRSGGGIKTYVNAATGDTADISGSPLLEQRRRVGDPLADASSPDRLIVYGPEGRPRCDVPGSGRLSNMHAVAQPGVAWLGRQFVYLASEPDAIFLRVTDRATCATVATLPDPGDTLDLIGAPNVTLVRSLTRDGDVVIDGYAP